MSDDDKDFDKDESEDDDFQDGEPEAELSNESSSEDEPVKPVKKKKKVSPADASFFLDVEAEVDEDEDEDEIEEAEEGFVEPAVPEVISQDRSIYRRAPQTNLDDDKVEEIARRFEEKHRNYLDEEEDELGEEGIDIKQQSLLPSVKDPKLWMIKCKQGKEKQVVFTLMSKFLEKRFDIDRLQIKSVIAPEHLKGYVYIEAEKESHVVNAIKGMRTLQQYNLKLIPIKEMVDVLTVTNKSISLQKGDWVRAKRGIYRGDIAQVYENDEARGRVTIKIIPRLDYKNMKQAVDEKRKRKIRPPSRLFNADEANSVEMVDKRTIHGDTVYVFMGNNYNSDGYLLKSMNIKSLETTGVLPTIDEIQKFQERPENLGDENRSQVPTLPASLAAPLRMKRKANFMKGDVVKVVEGDLRNLEGVVESADDDTVMIRPKHDDLKDLLQFPSSQLQKFFKMGDHVKAITGSHEGETGLILRVEENYVVFFSDLTQKEIKVLTSDIQEASDVSSGKLQLGNYELHDLVQINPQTVGVIVKIEKDSFKVLDNNGTVQAIRLQEIGNKRNLRDAVSFDANHNQIGIGDVVKVKDGNYKERQGTIKHLYRYFAFLHSRDMLENSGIFVIRTGNCFLLGGSKRGIGSQGGMNQQYPPMSPGNVLRSPARNGPSGGGGGGPGGQNSSFQRNSVPINRRKRDDSLLNKTVVIQQGPHKGYIGIVKDCTDTNARVELHTNCKTITIKRENLVVKNENTRDVEYPRTPMYGDGSRTPMRFEDGSQTPSRTPSRSYGSATPIHGTVWDPNTPNTPMRTPSWDPDHAYNSWTPSNEYASIATPGQGFNSFSPAIRERDREEDNTPSSIFTPNTPGFAPVSTPFADQRTPQEVSTPYSAYTPTTPGLPTTPSYPGVPEERSDKQNTKASWLTSDILVRVSNDTFRGGIYFNKEGVIKQISADSCKVQIGGDLVQIPAEFLETVTPKKKDNVKVIRGENAHQTGSLIGIDGADGIVKMSTNQDIKILDLHLLAVYVP